VNPARILTALAVAALLLLPWPVLAGDLDEAPGFGDVNQVTDKPTEQGTAAPEETPPGDEELHRVDWANQDGPREARDHLARVIGKTPVGYDRAALARAGRRDLQSLGQWFNQIALVAPKFPKNAEDARKNLKGDLSAQTIYSVHKARTKGLFDKQSDKDDYRVVASFLTYCRDQKPPSKLLTQLSDRVVELIVAAGPAYKVELSADEARDPATLAAKFERDLDKGALQFAAAYLQSLQLDKGAFEAANKLAQLPQQALAQLNAPQTHSDLDEGSDRGQSDAQYPELTQARQAREQAKRAREMAERAFADAAAPLGAAPQGGWTRESLLAAFEKNPELKSEELAKAFAALQAAVGREGKLGSEMASMERDATVAAEAGKTLSTRYEQLSQSLSQVPEGVKLTGPLGEHRQRLEARLQHLKGRDLGRDAFALRNDKVKAAQLINEQASIGRAVTAQLAAESGLEQLGKQRASLDEAVKALEANPKATPAVKERIAKARAALAQQNSEAWEKSLFQAGKATAIHAKATEISQQLEALGKELGAVASEQGQSEERDRAERAINQAQGNSFRSTLATSDALEVTLASPVAGKVKPHVRRGLLVLNREQTHVGGLQAGATAEIVGVLYTQAGDKREVAAYRIKLAAGNRTMARVTEGFVPTRHFGPADAAAFQTAFDAACAAGPETPADRDSDEAYRKAVAHTKLWTTFQNCTASVVSGNLDNSLELKDSLWPATNQVRFKTGVVKKMRDCLEELNTLSGGKVSAETLAKLDELETFVDLGRSGMRAAAKTWANGQLVALESLLKAQEVTAPPPSYKFGERILSFEAR
jgi:hypothetical protein